MARVLLKPHQGFGASLSHRYCGGGGVLLLSARPPPLLLRRPISIPISTLRRSLLVRAFDSSPAKPAGVEKLEEEDGKPPSPAAAAPERKAGPGGRDEDYPAGEFEMEELGSWTSFLVRLRLLFALPWERVKKGSVLSMKLRGQVSSYVTNILQASSYVEQKMVMVSNLWVKLFRDLSEAYDFTKHGNSGHGTPFQHHLCWAEVSDQLKSRFTSGLSLPQICENFTKAAYDPRICGIYLQIEPLSCGWGKIDEIRRHILNFKKSGKFIVSYLPICGEKEYYLACACGEVYVPPSAYVALYGLTVQSSFLGGVLERVGIEPQIQRIGKYKSAGDQLSCKTMSNEVREMLSSLLDNIYGNWVDTISLSQGKEKEEIENFLNSGVCQVERLKEEGWITNILYDDEVMSMLKKKLGQTKPKNLLMVDYRKYSRVRKWTLGLEEGRDQIAIIRASGSISRARSPLSTPSSGIIGEQLIDKIRSVKDSERYKAVILRIDSPGGDALASDLMWREIRLLSATKPVIASMSDVAASGGYYMAMAADTIVAERLTLTGSIGVVTGKFSLQKLYDRIGFSKEIISRGKYAELNAAEQRPFKPDEAELFANAAQNAYRQFRDKAAYSRSMTADEMEQVAQGRVWSGKDAASQGLVDAIGGFSRAVAIAKQKANIPQDRPIRLVEVSKPSPSLPEILSGIGNSLFGLDTMLKEVLQNVTTGDVQARMDGILFERLDGASDHPIFALIRDCMRIF